MAEEQQAAPKLGDVLDQVDITAPNALGDATGGWHAAPADTAEYRPEDEEPKPAGKPRGRQSMKKELTPAELESRLGALLDETTGYSRLTETKGGRGGRRRGLSEKEEDEQLVREAENEEVVLTQPLTVTGKMKHYQVEGLNWLYQGYKMDINCILADEMGLGKTLQTISILAHLRFTLKILNKTSIIICPRSTLENWENEVHRWCPRLKAMKFYGTRAERDVLWAQLSKGMARGTVPDRGEPGIDPHTGTVLHSAPGTPTGQSEAAWAAEGLPRGQWHSFEGQPDVILTTYEMMLKERQRLHKLVWLYVIMDEAHRIKNERSVLSEVVRCLESRKRLLITGTPLQNNLRELWALLNFIMPTLFHNADDFEALFDFSKVSSSDKQGQIIGKLHKILKPFMLRRLKTDVEADLPPKREIYVFIGMSKLQKQLYAGILGKNVAVLNAMQANKTQMLNILMQLRKCCNHPYLFDGIEPGPPYVDGQHMVEACGKMSLLDKLLPRVFADGSRVLLFCQMTRALDVLEDYCRWKGFPYVRIDGNTHGVLRQERVDLFNTPDSPLKIFLLSTRAGGLGINLATADIVILYDSDFNPQMDLQAQDRAHRIGQKKKVMVYRLVSQQTVEERIVERAAKKLKLDSLVIQKGRLGPGLNELQEMIQFGAQEVYRTQHDSSVSEADIDVILADAESRTAEIEAQLSTLERKFDLTDLSLAGGLGQYRGGEPKGPGRPGRKRGVKMVKPQQFFDLGERKTKWKSQGALAPVRAAPKRVSANWRTALGGGFDFQFYDNQRLDEIDATQQAWDQNVTRHLSEIVPLETEKSTPGLTPGATPGATPAATPRAADEPSAKVAKLEPGAAEAPKKLQWTEGFSIVSNPTVPVDAPDAPILQLRHLDEQQIRRLLRMLESHLEHRTEPTIKTYSLLYSRANALLTPPTMQYLRFPAATFDEALPILEEMIKDGRGKALGMPVCDLREDALANARAEGPPPSRYQQLLTTLVTTHLDDVLAAKAAEVLPTKEAAAAMNPKPHLTQEGLIENLDGAVLELSGDFQQDLAAYLRIAFNMPDQKGAEELFKQDASVPAEAAAVMAATYAAEREDDALCVRMCVRDIVPGVPISDDNMVIERNEANRYVRRRPYCGRGRKPREYCPDNTLQQAVCFKAANQLLLRYKACKGVWDGPLASVPLGDESSHGRDRETCPRTLRDEKKTLLGQGFLGWTRADFQKFTANLIQHGPEEIETVYAQTSLATGKPRAEIKQYCKTFLRRYQQMESGARLLARVERAAEGRIAGALLHKTVQRYVELQCAATSVTSCFDLKLPRELARSPIFTPDEDRVLLWCVYQYGQNFKLIHANWKYHWGHFRGFFLMASKSLKQLQARCLEIVQAVQQYGGCQLPAGSKKGRFNESIRRIKVS